MRLLLFTIDDGRYGVATDAVVELVRAVAVTPLPNAPTVIDGVIDYRGVVIPVFDLRQRFALPRRPVDPADHFVIVRAAARVAALHVDRIVDIVEVADDAVQALAVQMPSAGHVAGVVALPDGLAVIHDVDTFLSRAESESLDAALAASVDALRGTPRDSPRSSASDA